MAKLTRVYPPLQVSLKRDRLTWIGNLTPTLLSRTYRVKLQMHKDDKPRIWLVEPALQMREGMRAPHLYPDDSLCLYLPRNGDWDNTMLLVDTIIPWASEWLAHYEIWLSTGDWTGGGVHPGLKRDDGRQFKEDPSKTLDGAHPPAVTAPPESAKTSGGIVLQKDAISKFLDGATAPVEMAASPTPAVCADIMASRKEALRE